MKLEDYTRFVFVTFKESTSFPRGCSEHNGSTVSILSKGSEDLYEVGRYNVDGEYVKWTAFADELIGFDPSVVANG
jgi:hypothetical protein